MRTPGTHMPERDVLYGIVRSKLTSWVALPRTAWKRSAGSFVFPVLYRIAVPGLYNSPYTHSGSHRLWSALPAHDFLASLTAVSEGTTMQHPRPWRPPLPHRNIFLLALIQTPTPDPPPENSSRTRFASMVRVTLSTMLITIQNRQPLPAHPLLLPPPPNTMILDSSPKRLRLRPSVLLMAT